MVLGMLYIQETILISLGLHCFSLKFHWPQSNTELGALKPTVCWITAHDYNSEKVKDAYPIELKALQCLNEHWSSLDFNEI